jgi:hypothetical protein
MTKEELESKFFEEIKCLNTRALNVLHRCGLLDFDTFFYWHFIKKEEMDFLSLRRCGYKTEEELERFVRIMKLSERNDDKLKLKFEKEVIKLNARARNILEDQGLLYFDFFYDLYFIQNNRIDFKKIRNCGIKTRKELDEFVTTLCNSKEIETRIINPIIIRPQLLQNNPIIPLKVDFRTILFFEKEFEKLSVRSKNILKSLDASTINGFQNNILFKDDQSILIIRNCGKHTLQEILDFKNIFRNIIDRSGKPTTDNFCFSSLEIYLNFSNRLKSVETEIFKYYYGFIKSEKRTTLTEIGYCYNLSRERVRQISKSLLQKIKGILINVTACYKLNFHQYFNSKYFVVNQEFADKINQNESTNFSTQFISFVLSITCLQEYSFYSFGSEYLSENVIFIHGDISIDVVGLFQYLKKK